MAWLLIKWGIPRWLVVIRLLQALGELVTAAMNGFLLVYIRLNGLGFSGSMYALEIMACIALIYSSLVLLIQHTGRRRHNSSSVMVGAFVVLDLLVTGMLIAIITVLATTGVPSNCQRMTRDNTESDDDHNNQPPVWFGDGKDEKGKLDRFCSLEKAFYDIAVILIFTYIATITLGALRIAEHHYTKNSSTDLLAKEYGYQLDYVLPEAQRQESIAGQGNMGVSTQGVLTPASRSSPTMPPQGPISPNSNYQPFHEQRRQAPHPVSPISPVSPLSPTSRSFVASPVTFDPPSPMGGLMIGHDTDAAAEATITDGYRHQMQPGMPSLPPYSPGPSRGLFMTGHGNESNEMRLSDYVKGETRAQNMKDSGGGM